MERVKIPNNCPSCGTVLKRINNQLFCTNASCSQQNYKKVVNYAKVLKIKGLGEKTVEKLDISSISEIYNLDYDFVSSIIGDKLTEKLKTEIDKTKSIPFYMFLAAAGIPLVGQAVAGKLSSVSDPDEITYDYCKSAGIGDKATENILNWLDKEYYTDLIDLPIEFTSSISNIASNAVRVCITGKIQGYTKESLAKDLSANNVIVENDVTKHTNYLICESRKNSIKEQKALKLNIPILTLKEFKENI